MGRQARDYYEPQAKQREILNTALAHINSVPYKVTLRWLFYRLYGDGIYTIKKDYTGFIALLSRARKNFYGGWRPDSLADDTRDYIKQGDGWGCVADWVEYIGDVRYEEDIWFGQDYYIEVWFEAAAMLSQFRHYVREIPLLSFHGDCCIAAKYEAALRLNRAHEAYQKPIVVIYFGDDDEKGRMIPQSAINDIQEWCEIPFEFVRGGLLPGDGERLGLKESIDHPGDYQWESLDDQQAGEIIKGIVFKYFNQEAADGLHRYECEVTEKYQTFLREQLANFEGN